MSIKKSILILILLGLLVVGGYQGYCYLHNDYSQVGLRLQSSDGHYTVNVPLNWEQIDPPSSSVLLAAQGKNGDMYLQISLDGNAREGSLLSYVKKYIREIGHNSDNNKKLVITTAPKIKKLDGHRGYYFELETTSNEIQVHIWSFVYATNGGYICFNITAPTSEFSTYSDIAVSILESFKGK